MNERIRELIVQSGNGQFHNGKCYPHIGSRTLEDWDKFAELIVKEILPMVPPECDAVIKEHFGVE